MIIKTPPPSVDHHDKRWLVMGLPIPSKDDFSIIGKPVQKEGLNE